MLSTSDHADQVCSSPQHLRYLLQSAPVYLKYTEWITQNELYQFQVLFRYMISELSFGCWSPAGRVCAGAQGWGQLTAGRRAAESVSTLDFFDNCIRKPPDFLLQADARVLRTVLSLMGEHDRLLKGGDAGLRGHIVAEMADIDNEPLVRMVGTQSCGVYTVTR